MSKSIWFNSLYFLTIVIFTEFISCNVLMQIRMKCPQALQDMIYLRCEADVRKSWHYEKNPEKAFCCSRLDSYECLFSSIERNCLPNVLDFFRAALRVDNFNFRYNGFCLNYSERSECHIPVWAIVTIPVICGVILILIGVLVYYKCFK